MASAIENTLSRENPNFAEAWNKDFYGKSLDGETNKLQRNCKRKRTNRSFRATTIKLEDLTFDETTRI